MGTVGDSDHFGFVSHMIGAFKLAATTLPLTAAFDTFDLGATGNVTLRELPLVFNL